MVEVCLLSLCVVGELQQHSTSLLLVAGTLLCDPAALPPIPTPFQLGELGMCDPCCS